MRGGFDIPNIFGMLDQHDLGLMVALLYDTKGQFLERKRRYASKKYIILF
jgi:hypothetical protein